MSRYVSLNGDLVTATCTEPFDLKFVDLDESIIDGLAWCVAFDEHGDAWQVTYLDGEDGLDERVALPGFIGPAPA